MPTYEYVCKSCGEHIDVVQSFHDEPLNECPACGGQLRKVFGNIGIVFKGSGFYKTDSRSGSAARKKGTDEAKPDKDKAASPASSGSEGGAGAGSGSGDSGTTSPSSAGGSGGSSAAPSNGPKSPPAAAAS
jgi:putative FmdB family regulatory protein